MRLDVHVEFSGNAWQSALHIALVTLTSCLSLLQTRT